MQKALLAVMFLASCCASDVGAAKFSSLVVQTEPTAQLTELSVPSPSSSVILFETPIDSETVVGPIAKLNALKYMNHPPEVVYIQFDSPGGEVDAGLELSKAIERAPEDVTIACYVDGMAASMAFFVLQSCDLRVMSARSMLMFHSVSFNMHLTGPDKDNAAQLLRVYNAALLAHVAERLNISAAEIEEKIAHGDWWLSAADALKVGAIDTVLPSKCMPVHGIKPCVVP